MTQRRAPNLIELYEAAAQGFLRTLAGVKLEQLNNPTPCTKWNVKALISHNLKVPGFVQGVFNGDPTDTTLGVSDPLPPEGPVAALQGSVASVLEMVKTPGALEKSLATPFGPMTGGQFLFFPFTDLLIHTWDLARATGQDAALDSKLVEVCYNGLLPLGDALSAAPPGEEPAFAKRVPVPNNASLQDKLIGLTGRHP